MRVLVVTAVRAERDALLRDLTTAQQSTIGPYEALLVSTALGEVTALTGGVGPSAAAAATATALALAPYDVVLNAGVAGAFRDSGAQVGGVVVADRLVAADLGAWAPDGFLDLAAIGLDGNGSVAVPAGLVTSLSQACTNTGLPTVVGTVLTLSAMTGTDLRAEELLAAHGAVAEAMEGTGVAEGAARYGLPVGELRTISNLVGARDREAWRLADALDALALAGSAALSAEWVLS